MNIQQGEIICIDKPYEITSFGALARVRYLLSRRLGVKRVKIGHAGTLDPLATGVLVLCTGKATKRIAELQTHTKEYVATLQHPVNETSETAHITSEAIHQALQQFVGEIQQVPPTYSAVKVNGDRAYDLRRKGKDVELAPKTLRIDEIEVQHFDPSQMLLTIRVVCGKGTYIRALARDLGRALNSGAYLTALRRTRVGDVRVENCLQLDTFKEWLDKQEFEEPQTQQQKQQEP